MPVRRRNVEPRTFYLNERHELSRQVKDGGGRIVKYPHINWATKGRRLNNQLSSIDDLMTNSADPLRGRRYFMMALPAEQLEKESKAKNAKGGVLTEAVELGGQHSRVFRRLGLDLLSVSDTGQATVHATRERFEQLLATSRELPNSGTLERSRWAPLEAFAPIPRQMRVDDEWLKEVASSGSTDTIIELQPVLTSAEVDEVISRVLSMLSARSGERLSGSGQDFSGRHWFRGNLGLKTIDALASSLYSVQSLHAPILSRAASTRGRTSPATESPVSVAPPTPDLPCVAIIDSGVRQAHPALRPFRRGQYRSPDSTREYFGSHGALVASRVVFGDMEVSQSVQPPLVGECSFFDANIFMTADYFHDKELVPAITAIRAVQPDIRVFNVSLGNYTPLAQLPTVKKREALISLRDLDNKIFESDILVVVAAGNSPPGLVPSEPYPRHLDDSNWALGSWALGFNTLTCGSFVATPRDNGLTTGAQWPSPFTRVGHGMSDSPVPDFGANGGDGTAAYSHAPGLGVWGLSDAGLFEDHSGTSMAAPLLAREAAKAIHLLSRMCPPDTQPFAVTAKAFLRLVARRKTLSNEIAKLADRTIGRGRATAKRLANPRNDSAVYVWQGVLESPRDVARVQVPIPKQWLAESERPVLRLVWAWDTPVNSGAPEIWACRHVTAKLRPGPDDEAVRGSNVHRSYPLAEKRFDLSKSALADHDIVVAGDVWMIELNYTEECDYVPAMTFSPLQRVAVAVELVDESEDGISPQALIQAMPVAATMTRLSAAAVRTGVPIVIRSTA
jgi:hypothetical protein